MKLLLNIITASILLSIIFSGYVVSSSLTSTVFQGLGFYIYSVTCFCSIIGSISSSFIVYYITGIKWSIVISSLGFIVWLVAFFIDVEYETMYAPYIIFAAAIIYGICSGIFRSQQYVWVTTMPIQSDPAYYIGIFNSIFGLNGIIGFSVATLTFYIGIKLSTLIAMLIIATIVASILLSITLNNVPLNTSHEITLSMYLSTIRNVKLWMLFPITIAQSVSLVYTSMNLPLLVTDNFLVVSLVFFTHSITYCLNSYLVAVLYQRIGATRILLLCMCNTMIICVLITCNYYLREYIISYNYYPILIIGFFLGINDSTWNSVISTELAIWFDNNKTVFGVNRTIYSISTMIFTLVALYSSWYIYTAILFASMIVSIIMYRILLYYHSISDNTDDEAIPLLPNNN